MALSQVVNLPIGSEFGFKRPIFAPVPIVETVKTFNASTVSPGTLANTSSRVITITPPADFVFPIGNTSTIEVLATYGLGANEVLKAWTLPFKQNIAITNVGNSAVTLFPRDPYRPTFMIPPPILGQAGTYPVIHSINGAPVTTSTFVLAAGQTSGFELAYYGTDVGDFTSFLTIESTAGISTVTLFTNQIVLEETFELRASTTTFTVNTTELGKSVTETIYITPVFNGIPNDEFVLDFTTSLVGGPGWIITTGTNLVNITWDPDIIDNSTGTYTSILTISAESAYVDIINTSTVSIDYDQYKNLSTWISPAASYNSIIGISFDIFDGTKTLTIGAGAGGDGTPIYADGGNAFAVLRNLAIGAGTIDVPYPYWSTVYSFPLESAGTYLSGEIGGDGFPVYMKKTTDGLNYAEYFGYEQSVGSMFVVEYDGYANVNIKINNLRELSGDAEFDATMENLTRAFHYHSTMDYPTRYYQLETPIAGDPRTQLFRGFVATALPPNTETWIVNTSLVPLPT
jgi:hypothetical protein